MRAPSGYTALRSFGCGRDYLADAVLPAPTPCHRRAHRARDDQANEAGIHFVAAGHYATETFGVKRIGEHLSERFEVDHVFIDVPNPI